MSHTIFTVGYEGRSLSDFVGLLREHGITHLVDVRALPLSRRKGFSKTPLGAALREVDIEYVHVRAAGNPYRDQKGDIERCLKAYGAYIDRQPEVLDHLEELAGEGRVAFMCLEADANHCHRSVLTDRLRRRRRPPTIRDL